MDILMVIDNFRECCSTLPTDPHGNYCMLPASLRNMLKVRDVINNYPAEQDLPSARPGWDEYFLGIADAVAKRADCTRRQVGAVIVDYQHRIASSGYNGAASGGKSCLKGECPRGKMSAEQIAPGSSYDTGAGTCIALHAEQNAIMYSSRDQRLRGTCYVTTTPCEGCMRMLSGSGVWRVVWWSDRGLMDEHQFYDIGLLER